MARFEGLSKIFTDFSDLADQELVDRFKVTT
jgi:hypothetical protein